MQPGGPVDVEPPEVQEQPDDPVAVEPVGARPVEAQPFEGDAGEPDEVADLAPTHRLFDIARRVLPWVAFTLMSALFLRPILIAPIIGDDFLNPWQQFSTAGMSPTGIWRYAINGTTHAGHFNFLGQLIGCYLLGFWMWMMGDLGIRYTEMYAVTKLIVYVLTVASVASFVRAAAGIAGRVIGPWRSRIYVAVPLFGVLQIHLPWSHDPVATYPMSGFASAAIGFLAMKLAIDAYRTATLRASIYAGLAAVAAILYYEIEIACIVALVPLALWGWQHHGGGRRGARRMALPFACNLVVPTVLTAILYLYARAQSVNYGGTEVAVGSGTAKTFRIAFLGTFPGAAWNLTREFLAGPIPVRGYAVAVLVVVATVLFSLAAQFRDRPTVSVEPGATGPTVPTPRLAVMAMLAVCAAPVIYWVGATLIQSSTPKVQTEITRIGAVYNYYAVGTAAIASLAVLVVLFWPRRWNVHVIRIGALAGVIAFIAIQYMINWNINDRYKGAALYNRQLHAAFSDQPPMAERCAILARWEAVDWPEYLEVAIIDGFQASYEHFHDEPFCEGFTRSVPA